MSPPARRSGPEEAASHRTPAGESDTPEGTTGDVEVDYDLAAPEALGYSTDPLTADEWGAICLAESRDVSLSEVGE